MANLKEIRTRIKSVASTQQITSAMKMVAAAKLRKAQDAILRFRPYAQRMQEILSMIAESMDSQSENVYTELREPDKILVLLFTSNRGLCGAFNANAIRKALSMAWGKFGRQLEAGNLHFMCIGKKGSDFLRSYKLPIYATHTGIAEKPRYDDTGSLADELMEKFRKKEFDRIILIYNQFKNAAVQVLTEETFLPVEVKKEENPFMLKKFHDFIFEPSREEIVQTLMPTSLRLQLFKVITDAYAAEQGARMTAMHQATDNATELIRELRLNYNKARQAAITKEILEIVGGANAME